MAPKRKLPTEPPAPINDYGCKVKGLTQFAYDRYAFADKVSIDKGAPRRIDLFKSITEKLNPRFFEWHRWTENLVEAVCENRWVAIAGAAGSAKTRNIAGFACAWWLCAPAISSVIFCSTSVKALRRRGWAEVQKFNSTIPGPRIGNFVDSQMTWQSVKGDSRHAIMGIAVEGGEMNKASDKIKGVHTRRQMVIIDEATAVPPAIFEACTNLYSSPKEFILVMLGNPRSRLDQFGKFMEPKDGWQSVSVNDYEWETLPQMDGSTGICIRFDAEDSPNIVEGRIVSKYLPTKEHVENKRKMVGCENDPSYWSNERGFPPPEGLNKNVFSETMLQTHKAYDMHQFTGRDFQIIGVLDPARADGDRAAIRFAKMGEIRGGEWGMQVAPPIVVKLNAKSNNPVDYQLTEQTERECAKIACFGPFDTEIGYSCPPEHFGVDSTGGGADLTDIFQRNWSNKIVRIVFSESPSDDSCSHEDIRPASEVYLNKRVEMYFRAANAVKSGQLKGIDKETAKELVTIEFDDSKPKIRLMSKKDYKIKFGKSPDFADTIAMLVELARRLGFKIAAVGQTVSKGKEFDEFVNKSQQVYATVDYSEEEDPNYEDVLAYEAI